ncbi:hypothetical protein AKL44_00450 [Salmonella enterica]|nr:hypothetical protein [Salmonella enterica]EAX1854979.1 hypothetical protein [Salmonella enterica]
MNKIITIIFNQIKITNASDHSFKMINKNQKKSFCNKKAGILPAGMECVVISFPLRPQLSVDWRCGTITKRGSGFTDEFPIRGDDP